MTTQAKKKKSAPQDEYLPLLPFNYEAERAVLGAILLDARDPEEPDEIDRAINKALDSVRFLHASDFYNDYHKVIFTTMLDMTAYVDAPLDLITVCAFLQDKGKLDEAGGAAYISTLSDGLPRIFRTVAHARIVQEHSRRRQLAALADTWKRDVLASVANSTEISERARVQLEEFAGRSVLAASLYDTREEFEHAPAPTFSIKGFLQDYSVNAIAGLSGHGKTWFSLNIVAALLFGPGKLWETFEVTERAQKIVYLIPEASRAAFKTRLKAMNLYDEIDKRLFVRTLSKGAVLSLTDAAFLRSIKGAHSFCDTAIRFMHCTDENSANEAAVGLSNDFFAMQRAEARSVNALFHAPKGFRKERAMTLENMVRGSGEFGAMLSIAWGLRQIDREKNIIHIENLKDRDFQSCGPFQLIGRPYIDTHGAFKMHLEPGMCARLDAYLPKTNGSYNHAGGARQSRTNNLVLMSDWLSQKPNMTSAELVEKYHELGVSVNASTVRHYRSELLKNGCAEGCGDDE